MTGTETPDLELPGMEGVERVEVPFARTEPKYRVQWRLIVTGYARFTTWDDPEEHLEDELHTDGFYDQILTAPDSDVAYDGSWYQAIEVQQEDGTWKPVDAETYDRISSHEDRSAS